MPSGSSAHPVMHDGNGSRCNGNMKHDYYEKHNKKRADDFYKGFIAALNQYTKMSNHKEEISGNSEDWKNGFKKCIELFFLSESSKPHPACFAIANTESEKYRRTLNQGENG